MCQGLYKWPPFEPGVIIIGWGLLISQGGGGGGEKTGSERERDLLKATQQCLGWKAVALPSFCYTFDGQDVQGDRYRCLTAVVES